VRCKACNVLLEDFETTRKDKHGNYIDMCSICITAGYDGGVDPEDTSGSISQDDALLDAVPFDYNINISSD